MEQRWLLLSALLAASCGGKTRAPIDCADRTQTGGDQTHGNQACVTAQTPARVLADVVYDPLAADEISELGGALNIHYQAPLIHGDDVYMLRKGGYFVGCHPPGSGKPAPCGFDALDHESWSEVAYRFDGDRLVERWAYITDWKAPPVGFEMLFAPALGAGVLYVPGSGATVHALDADSGRELRLINPYGGAPDPNSTFISGALTVDSFGNLYFSTIRFLEGDEPQSLLVKVSPTGDMQTALYEGFVRGAFAEAMCELRYNTDVYALPLPPPPDMTGLPPRPPQVPCGPQRPAYEAGPALSDDGDTVYVVSRAQRGYLDGYLTALRASDLTPRWSTALRELFDDGCGVSVADDGDPTTLPHHCRPGTPRGIDPGAGRKGAGQVLDVSSSTPVALPDGVLYGSYSAYNNARGHLVKLDRDGHIVASYDFGWDLMPAVWRHDGTYSIIIKDNHYNDVDHSHDIDAGPFYITQLDPDLHIQWQLKSTNTQSCNPDASGRIACAETHPNGFEWCINSPAVDRLGRVFVNSEDGNVYAIGQGGVELGRLFQGQSLPSAYTPVTIDARGRVLTLNGGHLIVSGH